MQANQQARCFADGCCSQPVGEYIVSATTEYCVGYRLRQVIDHAG